MDAAERFHRGVSHFEAHRFEDACSEFTRAIERAPDLSDAYTGRDARLELYRSGVAYAGLDEP